MNSHSNGAQPRRIFVALLTLAALAGCASKAKQELDASLARTPEIKTGRQLQDVTGEKIAADTALSKDQRDKLLALRDSVRSQVDQLQQESLKLRAVLTDQLLAQDYNPAEVGQIKSRMRSVERQRLAVMFKGIDEANRILGRKPSSELRRDVLYDMMVQPSVL